MEFVKKNSLAFLLVVIIVLQCVQISTLNRVIKLTDFNSGYDAVEELKSINKILMQEIHVDLLGVEDAVENLK